MISILFASNDTLSTPAELLAHISSSRPAAQAMASSGSIRLPVFGDSLRASSLDSYTRSDMPIATAGSLSPPDALMLCRLQYMSINLALECQESTCSHLLGESSNTPQGQPPILPQTRSNNNRIIKITT
jgi:hypothetical protein